MKTLKWLLGIVLLSTLVLLGGTKIETPSGGVNNGTTHQATGKKGTGVKNAKAQARTGTISDLATKLNLSPSQVQKLDAVLKKLDVNINTSNEADFCHAFVTLHDKLYAGKTDDFLNHLDEIGDFSKNNNLSAADKAIFKEDLNKAFTQNMAAPFRGGIFVESLYTVKNCTSNNGVAELKKLVDNGEFRRFYDNTFFNAGKTLDIEIKAHLFPNGLNKLVRSREEWENNRVHHQLTERIRVDAHQFDGMDYDEFMRAMSKRQLEYQVVFGKHITDQKRGAYEEHLRNSAKEAYKNMLTNKKFKGGNIDGTPQFPTEAQVKTGVNALMNNFLPVKFSSVGD